MLMPLAWIPVSWNVPPKTELAISELSLVIDSLARLKEELMSIYAWGFFRENRYKSERGLISKSSKSKPFFKRYVQCAHKKANFFQCIYT